VVKGEKKEEMKRKPGRKPSTPVYGGKVITVNQVSYLQCVILSRWGLGIIESASKVVGYGFS
jgi:hypothetical protein